jgi:DNA helicase-2/ATP-dependent DNA helicase PcrA
MNDRLLEGLDDEQRAAVLAPGGPLAIIAPAGSGKTRVLTRRIAHRVEAGAAEPRHLVACTFTRAAAGELVDRLRALGVDTSVTAGTFHAIALAQLRRRAAERNWEPLGVLDRKARILGPLVGRRGAASTLVVADIASEIDWAKARQVSVDDYADEARRAGRRLTRPAGEIAELYDRYERELRKRRLVDFDDVLRRCADAIRDDEEFAAGQHWRFRHFFVDEFQDATPLQVRLLRAWLGKRTDLTVVGDPAQAIYGFAGADASPLREFDRAFPGGETVVLRHNYRSTPQVVLVAEAALGAAGARPAPASARNDGARPTFVAYDDDELEARGVADRCWRAFTTGTPWSEMAVLFRTNAQSSLFEAAFVRRGVPFRVADERRFATRPVVRVLLDRMRVAERENPMRSVSEQLADLATFDGDDATPLTDELRTHRDALLELGRSYLAADAGPPTVAGFSSWLDVATRGDNAQGPAVELATFHRAKGSEWPVVFVAGLERGLVPISWADQPAALDEERRLLHVGLTRAADELHCSWARARTVGSRVARREPSPWLSALEHTAASFAGAPVTLSTHVEEMRRALEAAEPLAEVPRPRPSRRTAR